MGRGPQKDWPENKRTWCYDFVSKKSWKILHTALTWGQTIIMFPVRKQTVGCHTSWWLHSRNKCNTMVDNTGHDSYRQKIEKLIPQYDVFLTCPGPMLRSSGTAVQLNLPCSYCNTCTVNVFSGPHFGDEHHNQKLCAQYHYSRATSPTEIHMYVLCMCTCVSVF